MVSRKMQAPWEVKCIMLSETYRKIATSSPVAPVILSIAIMLFSGFAMTRVTRRLRLPNVTAYILTGVLIGPCCLDLIPSGVRSGMDFIPDVALAFIAFSVGEFFRISTLKKNGAKVLLITLAEALMASALVFIATFQVLGLSLPFSIVLSALASATAPASTLMTIRQTHARGDFVDTLLQVVALDDVVSLVAYSIAISVALSSMGGARGGGFDAVMRPILVNLGVLGLGCLFGLLLKLLFRQRSTDNRLIVSIAVLFAFCGICAALDVSPLLGCMSMGTVYINLTDDSNLFRQLNYFSPPILLLFFVKSGMEFQLGALGSGSPAIGGAPLALVGVVYFIVRILGKYLGAWLGCAAVGKEPRVRNHLGLALIPQAGVSIGLAALGARTLGGQVGEDLQTIILASSVLYELAGPACAKLALYLSGAYSGRIEDVIPAEALSEESRSQTELEILIERIRRIQQELPVHPAPSVSEEEAAFTQAALEQQEYAGYMLRRRFNSKRFGG